MLNDALKNYRAALLREFSDLERDDAAGSQDRRTVMLDQQSVGRLSRMDAMQRQAMAQATARRRTSRRSRIEAALRRIEEGEFGFCRDCGEEIEAARLGTDPTVPRCISCTKG